MRPCLPTLCYPDVTLSYRAVAVWYCTPNTLTLAVAQATERPFFPFSPIDNNPGRSNSQAADGAGRRTPPFGYRVCR